jgi:dihydroxyacetone kinase-like predicted kinase
MRERGRVGDASIIRLRTVLTAGVEALEAHREQINALDAGGDRDGDTGDNMAQTLRAVLRELDRLADDSADRTIDEIGRAEIVGSVARAALLGARGRAGVILSQLVRGAAEELAGRPGELVDPVLIGAALSRAADQAYGSVRDPAEESMLTVVRDMADRVSTELAPRAEARLAPDATPLEQDLMIAKVIRSALESRRGSAARVDAGGYGIVVLIAGIVGALGDDRLRPESAAHRPPPPSS